MIPLHKSPQGFLEALALKVLGRSPPELATQLHSTYNATQHYRQDLLVQRGSSLLVTAGNLAGPTLTLANDSMWRLRGIGALAVSTAAGTPIAAYMNLNCPQIPLAQNVTGTGLVAGALDLRLFAIDPVNAVPATALFRAAAFWQPSQDFFIPGGSTFSMNLSSLLATDATISFNVYAEELGSLTPR